MSITLNRPTAGEVVTVAASKEELLLALSFPLSEAVFEKDGNNLVLSFDSGEKIVIENFYTEYTSENVPDFVVDGATVAGKDFFEALGDDTLMPAAGPAAGSEDGGRFYDDSAAALAGGVDALGTVAGGSEFGRFGDLDPGEVAGGGVAAAPVGPTDPGPTDPGPTDPGPTDPGPTDPGPTDPGPTDPGPTDPGPTDPGPTDPGPTDPSGSQSHTYGWSYSNTPSQGIEGVSDGAVYAKGYAATNNDGKWNDNLTAPKGNVYVGEHPTGGSYGNGNSPIITDTVIDSVDAIKQYVSGLLTAKDNKAICIEADANGNVYLTPDQVKEYSEQYDAVYINGNLILENGQGNKIGEPAGVWYVNGYLDCGGNNQAQLKVFGVLGVEGNINMHSSLHVENGNVLPDYTPGTHEWTVQIDLDAFGGYTDDEITGLNTAADEFGYTFVRVENIITITASGAELPTGLSGITIGGNSVTVVGAGDAGNDSLTSGDGYYTLTGGEGADTFIIGLSDGAETTITDFGTGADVLDLTAFDGSTITSSFDMVSGNTTLTIGDSSQTIVLEGYNGDFGGALDNGNLTIATSDAGATYLNA